MFVPVQGERLADSVFRNDGRWYFKFRVHETPIRRGGGVPETIEDTRWSVVEVTGSGRDAQPRIKRLRCLE